MDSFALNSWLVWRKSDSSWVWTLTDLGEGRIRLVTRVRAARTWAKPMAAALSVLLMEFDDFAMMRRMLLCIKERDEKLHC